MLKKSPSDWLSLGHGGSNPLDPHYLISPLAPRWLNDISFFQVCPSRYPSKEKKWMNIGLWYNRWKVKYASQKKGRRVSPLHTIPARISAPIMLSCLRKERKKARANKVWVQLLEFCFWVFSYPPPQSEWRKMQWRRRRWANFWLFSSQIAGRSAKRRGAALPSSLLNRTHTP